MSKPIKKQKWNNLDAFALLNNIATWDKDYINLKYVRLPDESNVQLRKKILDYRKNPADGVDSQSLINGLSNELGLNPYNVIEKTTFDLTRFPFPSGEKETQDIYLYYQPPDDSGWYEITPQLWNSGFYTDLDHTIPQSSGFIVWEDSYYTETIETKKTNNYSSLLTVLTPLPDESRIKVKYNTKLYDENNNLTPKLFTDMSNPYDVNDDHFIYRIGSGICSSDFDDKVITYHLDNMSDYVSGMYYTDNGVATGKLYTLLNVIDNNYRHRWKDVKNNDSIWDVNEDYSKGTIPSFYDTSFIIKQTEDELSTDNFNGGIDYQDPVLTLKNIERQMDGSIEHWYPVLEPGYFYVDGVKYQLMENPLFYDVEIERASTIGLQDSGLLPSGIQRWHKPILIRDSVIESGYIHKAYNYPITYSYFDSTDGASGYLHWPSGIYRHRPYLTNDMGYDLELASGEYNIDYETNIMYCSGLPDNCKIIWDNINISSGCLCTGIFTDLNPLNGENIQYSKYFFIIGDPNEVG